MSQGARRSGADDLAGYVAARWPQLVRTATLLGCPESAAADVALDALARCQRGWARTSTESDVDQVVGDELVAAWDRRRGGGDPVTAQPSDGGPDIDGTGAQLDLLAPRERAALVLTRYAGSSLGASQGVAVTDRGPSAAQLRIAAEQVRVLAPPAMADISARRRQDSRRRTRRAALLTVGTALPVLLIAWGLTWLLDGGDAPRVPDPDDLTALRVTRAEDPTDIVWEANGVLHLSRGTVSTPVLRQLAPAGAGAVYADLDGRVVALAADGVRTVLGHEDPAVGFVSSEARGWAAWVDPTGPTPQVVVVDVASERVVRRSVAAGSRPVAIDGDVVYLADDQGVRGWQPLTQAHPADVVEPADLVAAASSTRVYQSADTELQVFPHVDLRLAVTGVGGELSADGRLLLTRTSGRSGADGPVAVYDTATGGALQTGVSDDELALDATLGPHLSVTYLIARKVDRPQASDELRASFAGALQLRTCQLYLSASPPSCDLITDIPVSGISPMLAH